MAYPPEEGCLGGNDQYDVLFYELQAKTILFEVLKAHMQSM